MVPDMGLQLVCDKPPHALSTKLWIVQMYLILLIIIHKLFPSLKNSYLNWINIADSLDNLVAFFCNSSRWRTLRSPMPQDSVIEVSYWTHPAISWPRKQSSVLWYIFTLNLSVAVLTCWNWNVPGELSQWASYQIRQIVSCAGAGNAGNAFPRRRLQRKLVISDPCMHHGTCVTHVPWCMSGSLTHDGGENVPGIPGASAILRIWQDAHAVADYALDSFSNRWPVVMILTVCNVDIIVFYGNNFFNL